MTNDLETPRVKGFVPSILPWILAGAMFAVFYCTLGRSVNPFNLAEVSNLTDWTQFTDNFGPIGFLVIYPLRWLPVNLIPLGMNVLSAFFAAVTLGLLARSVALLPHDRTHEQREREENEFSILTIRTAWLPPLFAVLACGLQRTFWENAAFGTTETFNLLLFAYPIRCLLEYRVSAKESWLTRFAIVFGLAMANNWAMIPFLPLFLAAVIWIKGIPAFQPRFILRFFGLLLVGFLFVLLLPIVETVFHSAHYSLWQMVHSMFGSERTIFTQFAKFHRDVLGILALTSILPIFVMGIRWSSYFGDNSPLGIFLATSMFHIVHGLFLLVCVWVMFDSPISPRVIGFGFPFLPFYYLTALAIGYLSGYFLLVFGKRKPREIVHPVVRFLQQGVVVGVWLLLVGASVILVRRNLPHLKSVAESARMSEDYYLQIAKSLPPQGAVLLSDDGYRLAYLKAVLEHDNGHSPHLLIDTVRMGQEQDYAARLQKSNPTYEICGPWTNVPPSAPSALADVQLLEHLASTHPLYYIHPSFGYYFEKFYAEPHGLIYQLKPYPQEVWEKPALSKQLIDENEAFWESTSNKVLGPIAEYMDASTRPVEPGPWKNVLDRLHLKKEPETLGSPVSFYYARALNEWGGELQVAGLRKVADTWFDEASKLHPGSLCAQVNKQFDKDLAAGKKATIVSSKDIEKALENFSGGWTELLRDDGPVDEPSFRCQLGWILANGYNYRQAVQEFNRARTLVPDDLRIPLQLADIFTRIQTYTNGMAMILPWQECYAMALSNLDLVLKTYPNQPKALLNKSFVLMQMEAYDKAIEPLSRVLEKTDETNSYLPAHLNRAMAYFKVGNFNAAKTDYQVVSEKITNSYQAYYGLAEIAYHEKDKPAAIRNYELYLTNAPTDTDEAKSVHARLKELKSAP